MYGANINGMTTTVDIRAMTALKQDGTALIPASLVIVLKGIAFACNGNGSFNHGKGQSSGLQREDLH